MKYFKNIKVVYGLLLIVMFSSILVAKDNNTKMLLEAEHIKVASQGIAKNYFYIQQGIQTSSAKKALKKNILSLGNAIRSLQKIAKDDEIKNVIEFMFFSVEELKSILKEAYTLENGGLVLDYTETLLEGAQAIINKTKKDKSSMIEVVEEMSFLLQRVTKYYIAFRAGYKDDINVKMAQQSVYEYEKLLKKVQAYKYPSKILNGPVKKLSKYWPVSKSFYLGIKKNALPTIVFISTKHMESALKELSDYHSLDK